MPVVNFGCLQQPSDKSSVEYVYSVIIALNVLGNEQNSLTYDLKLT
jgi:hypothetical protein